MKTFNVKVELKTPKPRRKVKLKRPVCPRVDLRADDEDELLELAYAIIDLVQKARR
jgi:hypothetical protein